MPPAPFIARSISQEVRELAAAPRREVHRQKTSHANRGGAVNRDSVGAFHHTSPTERGKPMDSQDLREAAAARPSRRPKTSSPKLNADVVKDYLAVSVTSKAFNIYVVKKGTSNVASFALTDTGASSTGGVVLVFPSGFPGWLVAGTLGTTSDGAAGGAAWAASGAPACTADAASRF